MAVFNRFILPSIYFNEFSTLLGHVSILDLFKLVLFFRDDLHLWYLISLLHFRLYSIHKQIQGLLNLLLFLFTRITVLELWLYIFGGFFSCTIRKWVIRIDQKWYSVSLLQTIILEVMMYIHILFLGPCLRMHRAILMYLGGVINLFAGALTTILVFYFLNFFLHKALVPRFCCSNIPRVPLHPVVHCGIKWPLSKFLTENALFLALNEDRWLMRHGLNLLSVLHLDSLLHQFTLCPFDCSITIFGTLRGFHQFYWFVRRQVSYV